MQISHVLRYVVALVILTSAAGANSALMGIHDPSIVGNGATPSDGRNLTLDTDTQLEWLDINLTEGYSYDFVSTQFGSGGLFEGFRFATADDLVTFWTNAGLIVPNFNQFNDPAIPAFQALFGITRATNTNDTLGYFDDETPGPLVGYAVVQDRLLVIPEDNVAADDDLAVGAGTLPDQGSFILRDAVVPAPATMFLLALGLTGIARRRAVGVRS